MWSTTALLIARRVIILAHRVQGQGSQVVFRARLTRRDRW
jgi:hypothetical protein